MKKIALFLLASLMLAALCACGSAQPVEAAPAAAPAVEEDAQMVSVLPGADLTADPEEPEEAGIVVDEKMMSAVLKLKDENVSKLYELLGEPDSADYAPSCLSTNGDSAEDGELVYSQYGFAVITFRQGSKEIVYDVKELG